MIDRVCAGFEAAPGPSPETQLSECLNRLDGFLRDRDLDRGMVLRQTGFVRADEEFPIDTLRSRLHPVLNDFFSGGPPPTVFVGQPPAGGARIALEAWCVSHASPARIYDIRADDVFYRVLEESGNREIYTAATSAPSGRDPRERAEDVFRKITAVLRAEGLGFSDVVRQWNYIEGIVDFLSRGKNPRQNYQVFNDVRTRAYGPDGFVAGYPAATGIGMDRGGIVIECLAVKPGPRDIRILPLSNPRQTDAHRYSQQVLRGKALAGLGKKGTPKFERAKLLSVGNRAMIFISGTAAIRGQETVVEDAPGQTFTTLENIDSLISRANLVKHGFPAGESGRVDYLRVYVKQERDMPAVRKICREYHPGVPALYVISDICRPDLLVEIEGTARVSG